MLRLVRVNLMTVSCIVTHVAELCELNTDFGPLELIVTVKNFKILWALLGNEYIKWVKGLSSAQLKPWND